MKVQWKEVLRKIDKKGRKLLSYIPPVAITPSSFTAIALIIVFCWDLKVIEIR
jgi:hypothetical protein